MGNRWVGQDGIDNPNYRTGYCIKGKTPGFYNSWTNMKSRCLNKNHPKYHNYGGRGISICADWLDVKNFAKWALNAGWEKGLSIDRINNDGNYEPSNCQWVTMSRNSRKKSTTKLSTKQAIKIRQRASNGENWYDLAKEHGVTHGTIWFIMNNHTHTNEGMAVIMQRKKKQVK